MPFDPTPTETRVLTDDEKITESIRRAGQFFTMHPEGWCQYDAACTSDGLRVSPASERAAMWCMMGRIEREARTLGANSSLIQRIWHFVTDSVPGVSATEWNDAHDRRAKEVGAMLLKIASRG